MLLTHLKEAPLVDPRPDHVWCVREGKGVAEGGAEMVPGREQGRVLGGTGVGEAVE